MTQMCTAAANYFIELTDKYNEKNPDKKIEMSCKRLMKLLYFADIDYMKSHFGLPMFADIFRAWTSGPVLMEIYDKYKGNERGNFSKHISDPKKDSPDALNNEERNIIEKVFEDTIQASTTDLINYSHVSDGPWAQVYNDDKPDDLPEITWSEMAKYYMKRDWRPAK